ncbi:MAG TPA: hypothetical protein VEY07_01795 [Thermoplasmata archaeon]|nr:hypothetical protein [Thermoplasmata archaeon]
MTRRDLVWRTAQLLLVASLLAGVGVVAGAALKVTKGNTEAGFGTVVTGPSPGAWWTLTSFQLITSAGGLSAASMNVSVPSNLSATAGVTLSVGNLTGGTGAAVFVFQMTSGVPRSTELEVRVGVALSGAAVVLTVYLMTPASAPGGPLTEKLDVASPTVPLTGLTVQGYSATTLVCTSLGVCP